MIQDNHDNFSETYRIITYFLMHFLSCMYVLRIARRAYQVYSRHSRRSENAVRANRSLFISHN